MTDANLSADHPVGRPWTWADKFFEEWDKHQETKAENARLKAEIAELETRRT